MSGATIDWDEVDASTQQAGQHLVRAPGNVGESAHSYATEEFQSQLDILRLLSNSTDALVVGKPAGGGERVRIQLRSTAWDRERGSLNHISSTATQYLWPLIKQWRHAEYILTDKAKIEGDNLVRMLSAFVDSSALPGEAIVATTLRFDHERDNLIRLAARFATEGFSWGGREDVRITKDTARAFGALIARLPVGSSLPRIAPDGEGGLLLHWNVASQEVLAVLDNWTFHIIEAPTTPRAHYYDPITLDAGAAPPELLRAISE
jgi:hypothetical protein